MRAAPYVHLVVHVVEVRLCTIIRFQSLHPRVAIDSSRRAAAGRISERYVRSGEICVGKVGRRSRHSTRTSARKRDAVSIVGKLRIRLALRSICRHREAVAVRTAVFRHPRQHADGHDRRRARACNVAHELQSNPNTAARSPSADSGSTSRLQHWLRSSASCSACWHCRPSVRRSLRNL